MARQPINIGSSGNDGTGDKLRISFDKINQNFGEVYFDVANTNSRINTVSNIANTALDTAIDAFDSSNAAFDAVSISFSDLSNTVVNVSNVANAAFSKANTVGVSIPTTSKGQAGNLQGMFAANSTYLYYCTSNYVDGVADIWKRVSWSGDTW